MSAKFFMVLSLVAVLGVFVIPAPAVLALKQVSFPDSAKLQPIPKGVFPDVSGNVNKENNNFVREELPAEGSPAEENNPSLYVNQNNTDDASFSWGFLLLTILAVIILLLGAMFFVYKKGESEM